MLIFGLNRNNNKIIIKEWAMTGKGTIYTQTKYERKREFYGY